MAATQVIAASTAVAATTVDADDVVDALGAAFDVVDALVDVFG